MLKVNSKTVKEKIKNYILESAKNCDYIDGETFEQVAPQIAHAFIKEHYQGSQRKYNIQDNFVEWCEGLPSAINCDYYYNISAIDLLGDILEQTQQERNKYTEQESEKLLTYLLFKALKDYIYKII